MRRLLADVAAGRISVDDASERLRTMGLAAVGDFACLDLGRAQRKGVPEVVLGQGKSTEQVVAIVQSFLKHGTSVLCSRMSADQAAAVSAAGVAAEYDPRSSVLVVRRGDYEPPPQRGVVGVMAAGTSDVPVAEEAGGKLAAHPDDPPMPTVRGQPRLVYQPSHYQRLIDLNPSPANALEFCVGTLAEMTEGDIYETVDQYSRQGRMADVTCRSRFTTFSSIWWIIPTSRKCTLRM